MGDEEKKEKKKKSKKKSEEDAPAESAPAAAPPPPASKPASQKRRAQRSGSNVFAMFTQHQVQEFKEAFQLIDQDKDGFISKTDIRATFDSLGRLCTDAELESMVAEAPGPINFTMFLTIFGDRIAGTDEEDVIVNAFNMYDEGEGKCKEETLKRALTTWGEKFSQEEDISPIVKSTNFKLLIKGPAIYYAEFRFLLMQVNQWIELYRKPCESLNLDRIFL